MENQERRLSKAKVLTLRQFQPRRDLLAALLKDEERYTVEDVEKLMNRFLKGKVK